MCARARQYLDIMRADVCTFFFCNMAFVFGVFLIFCCVKQLLACFLPNPARAKESWDFGNLNGGGKRHARNGGTRVYMRA